VKTGERRTLATSARASSTNGFLVTCFDSNDKVMGTSTVGISVEAFEAGSLPASV
jgi:hypothetical protein